MGHAERWMNERVWGSAGCLFVYGTHITTGFDSRVNAENHFPSVGNGRARVMRTVMASEHADTSTGSVLECKGAGVLSRREPILNGWPIQCLKGTVHPKMTVLSFSCSKTSLTFYFDRTQ